MSEIIQYDPQEEQLDNFIVPVEPGFYLADNGRVATEFYQAGNEVVFVNKGRRISWTPNDMRYIDEFGMEDTIYTVQEVPLETKGNYARYNRAMPDVDDWFIQENDRLKHQILIQGFQPDPSPWMTGNIDFAVGGKMRFDDDLKIMANGQEQINPFETHGSIQLYDGDQLIFELPQIIAFDSAYDRKGTSGKYRVWFNDNAEMMFDIIIDYEWISSMERVYPVVIDPTVIVSNGYTFGSPTGRKCVELVNGWLIVGVYDSTNKRIILLKSADKGATWSQLCFVQNGTTSLFDFALSNLGNTIHLAFNNEESLNQQTKFLKIEATTVTNVNVYGSSVAVFGALKAEGFNGVDIFTEPNGAIHISSSFRVGAASYNPYNIYYTSSTDGSATWAAARNLTNYNNDIYKAYKPRVMVANGKPFVVFEFVEGGTYYGISVAYFTGTSWVHNQNGIRSSGQAGAVLPCPAVDKNGAVHVVWQENNDYTGKMNILYSKSTDGCATWSTTVDLTPAAFRKEAPVITIGKNGYLYVFLRGGNFDGSVGFYQLSRIIHNGTSWAAEETLTSYTSQKNITLTALFDPTLSTSLVGWAWSDGSTVQFEKIVLNQAPNAPILTTKTNFDATAAADFAWVYSDPDPSDTQSAYQLQVKDVATGSIVHDTGKVASTTAKRTIAASTLTNGKQYQWRVKTWDSSNTEGAYSDYSTFFTSAKPTVSFTNLTEGQTFGGSTITPEWSMSDPESEGQSAYRIELLSSTDELIWDSGKIQDSRGRSRTVGFTLENNKTYKIRITVWDTKDIPSASVTRTFNVAYTAPMVPQLATSADPIRGSIAVEVINDDNVAEFTNPLVANFGGKVSGSTIENPHYAGRLGVTGIRTPSETWVELVDTGVIGYDNLKTLNGTSSTQSTTANGAQSQHRFSFNVLEEIKRKTGITLSVEQAKSIITKLTADWHGWGTNKHATPTGKADLTGKVSGSTTENPHLFKYEGLGGTNTLLAPSSSWNEQDTASYGQVASLNGTVNTSIRNGSGQMAQQLFSFNLIEYIQRKYNFTIPGMTTADKVTWVKANIKTLTCNWYGKGSGPSGNKATLLRWAANINDWYNKNSPVTHSSSVITKLTQQTTNATEIDANGFIHFLAYAVASNGTIASTIETDFVELEVELAGADKAMFEVWYSSVNKWQSQVGYGSASHTQPTISKLSISPSPNDKIDTNGFVHWLAYAEPSNGLAASTINTDYVQLSIEFDYKKLIATLPKVISNEVYRRIVGELDWKRIGYVQPLLYGENLLPPFTEWTIHANARMKSPYELELVATATYHLSTSPYIPVLPNKNYNFQVTISGGRRTVIFYDSNKQYINETSSQSFTTPSNCVYIVCRVDNGTATSGTFTYSNPMLVEGSAVKPFSPQKYGGEFKDYTPASENSYEYKVKGIGSNLSSSESSAAAAAVTMKDVILSKASDPNVFVKLKWNPSRNEKRSRERTLSQFAGRQDPVAEFGNARSFNLDASFSILEKAELETLRMLVDSGDILLYRDGRGRREFVSIADLTITDEKPTYYQVSLPMTRVSYEEGI